MKNAGFLRYKVTACISDLLSLVPGLVSHFLSANVWFGLSHSDHPIALGVGPSDHATLYVICCPAGPYFRVARPLALKAVGDYVRSWPGGTGGFKLSLNYAPTFQPQKSASKECYDQILWLLCDKITEAGAMNFFAVIMRDDGGELLCIHNTASAT